MAEVTSGSGPGTTSGGRLRAWAHTPPGAGVLAAAALLLMAALVNIASAEHDVASGVPAWKPVAWELTSFCGAIAALFSVVAAQRAAPVPTPRWRRALAVHAAAALLFSAVHCLVMWTLRRLVYTLDGAAYGWTLPPGQILYEGHKDLFTYGLLAVLFWCVGRLTIEPRAAVPTACVIGRDQAFLTFRDGMNLLRTPVRDIVVAEAAGNYVSLRLRDGRQHLTRRTLARLAEELAPYGFLRVHRGWLVNPEQVRAVAPTSTGDYRLTLAPGIVVPLSRRYARMVQERLCQHQLGTS